MAIRTPIATSVDPRLARPGRGADRGSRIDAPAAWRGCHLESYLERKLHRQWRNRGS
ncbi:hypothetical protein JDM601_1935 [Mycolicibacter sinensis]|uniref:Uncharacterized protein n=2 Tax=Mycobacteriaceae TaxID=1762 RepID=F5Z3N5_MYCSD|nr:hypothetical protein JDM601_1935 [Mycolicibacter sinensis]